MHIFLHLIKSMLLLKKNIAIMANKNNLITLKLWFWLFQGNIINYIFLSLSFYYWFDVFDGVINVWGINNSFLLKKKSNQNELTLEFAWIHVIYKMTFAYSEPRSPDKALSIVYRKEVRRTLYLSQFIEVRRLITYELGWSIVNLYSIYHDSRR